MSDRSVTTDALATLGTIITDAEKRDAIHIAVEPVRAGEDLARGQFVVIIEGVAWAAIEGKALGMVDPWLSEGVKAGEWFWFVLKPRLIRSLRHEWEHPAFPLRRP